MGEGIGWLFVFRICHEQGAGLAGGAGRWLKCRKQGRAFNFIRQWRSIAGKVGTQNFKSAALILVLDGKDKSWNGNSGWLGLICVHAVGLGLWLA